MLRSLLFTLCFFAVSLCFAELFHTVPQTKPEETVRLDAFKTDTWYGSPYWSGNGWLRVGKHWQHPAEDADAVRTFVVPKDGNVIITGAVRKLHLDGDGVIAAIRCNGKEIWKKKIEGKDSIGIDPNLPLAVKTGGRIQFIVNKNQTIACDTTAWEPVITFKDTNNACSAADSFSKKQGSGNWYYEAIRHKKNIQPKIDIAAAELTSIDEWRTAGLNDTDMQCLIVTEWLKEDNYFAEPEKTIEKHLERSGKIVTKTQTGEETLQKLLFELKAIKETKEAEEVLPALKQLYIKTRLFKRSLLFADPRTNFGELLFVKARPTAYSHLVGQYFGWNQRPGGGIYVLEKPGYSLKHRDVLREQLPPGHVLEPRLSYDARKIAFSHVAVPEKRIDWKTLKVNEDGENEFYYHLYEMNIDGSNLRQLTDAKYDDMMPEYLPDGGLAFVSSRRLGYSRCFGAQFGPRWHSYTLHRLDSGGQITRLSNNDVSEWFPAVANDGHLWFARWDYIDRDAVTHQNLWAMRPDGTNPAAVWGNASPKPHCMFQAKPIPHSNKIVFIASPHHSVTAGPVCIVDPSIDINSLDAVTKITPGQFPEAESRNVSEYYNSPYPLGEDLFLAAYSNMPLRWEPQPNPDNALGLYLIDAQGNREVIYRDDKIGATCPLPIAARHVPPAVQGTKQPQLAAEGLGEMSIVNVYDGLGSDGLGSNVKAGSLKQLRIVQIFPKTTVTANTPRIGVAGEENTRAVLGVVPIEADGSAKFLVPVGKPLLFQVLDENGFAYQTMRSTTSVMPGEQVSCAGCHENKMTAAAVPQMQPLAFSKPAKRLRPTPESGRPYGFAEMVQPILNAKCVSCHNTDKAEGGYDLSGAIAENGFTVSYNALCKDKSLVPRFPERNQIQQTVPGGGIGARGSRLIQLLQKGHAEVKLTANELERIGTWIDLNAVFYGSYDSVLTAKQQRGEPIPMPMIE
ncbi:MAG: hypothetical protein LBT89_00320 [Planctomycetaceae bacterium]|jgi:hypothetical protein|nr:hypothetical protein [Planctomycetaceae bacterium]